MNFNIFNKANIYKLNNHFNSNNMYIMRDDLIPYSFGGNKARKLYLFFEDVYKNKSDCIVTYGSSSSNHCRIVANIAASKGLKCYIISPDEEKKITKNSQIVKLFGAVTIYCPISMVNNTINNKIEELKNNGFNPYFIPGGGHGNIGTHAYVEAYKEILDYEMNNNIYFDYIFFASGTGTTQAGLVCGKILNSDNRSIVGISIARKNPYGTNVIIKSIEDYLYNVHSIFLNPHNLIFDDSYILDGYGSFNDKILTTIKRILIQEGIPLDTTYTGKAFWGMEEFIVKNGITNKNILFIHTGGTPLFFDDLHKLS